MREKANALSLLLRDLSIELDSDLSEKATRLLADSLEAATNLADQASRQAPIGGTGCEPWLAGWALRRRLGDGALTRPITGSPLRGYVACAIAQATGKPTNDAAALAAWTKEVGT